MIQELLGGTAALIGGGERKISITGVLEGSASPSPSPSPSASTSSTTTTTTPTNASENQNLRCPRCDSSNTKFCYYNNYNLTQPRHFCKTCRRYWTKGGALRNVPIGGGCRKNKGTAVTTAIGKTSNGKVKTLSSEIGKPGFVGGYDHELPSNPVLWPSPQNSHLMALLRSVQNPDSNPNPSPNPMNNSMYVKEEAVLIGSHMASDPAAVFNGRTLGPDTFSQVPSIGLCSPFYRNNQQQAQQLQLSQQQQQNGFLLGEVQNSGIQELYQRLRLSANYYHDHAPVIHGNMASTTSAPSSTILESAPVSGGEFGYWNPTLSWPDLPTTNGAYP